MLARIDFIHSGYMLAKTRDYSKPSIDIKSKHSFVSIQEMRHPIVEQIIDNRYKPHDIELAGKQKEFYCMA